jgi:DNA invertase Pin-like site-specific DNA recombinase
LGVGYARFSSDKQESIPEQQGINREVAADNGVQLVKAFADPDVSRDLSDRPGLNEMIEYLETHEEVGYIVVNELERLTAGVSQRSQIVALCQRLRVTIVTEDMGAIDPFDDDKMHEADQRAVAAKGEVLKVRRRTRRNLRQKVINGTVAMRPAFGTRMKPLVLPDGTELPSGARYVDASGRTVRSGVLEVHPDELAWVIKMFEWADIEDLSYEKIARLLTENGVKTKSGNDRWRGSSVRGILTNPLYKGEMAWGHQATRRLGDGTKYLEIRPEGDPGRVTKPSPLGVLVDPVLWDRVNARFHKGEGWDHVNDRHENPERRYQHRVLPPQLLDNLVYCGRCGHKMYGRNDNAGRRNAHRPNVIMRYVCESKRPGVPVLAGYDGVCTTAHTMSEKQILRALATLSGPESRATVLAETDADVERQRRNIERQLDQLLQEYERGSRLAIKGMVAESVWEEMRAENEARRELLASRLACLGTEAEAPPIQATTALARSFGDLLPLLTDKSLPIAARRQALDAANLITRIYADNPSVSVVLGPGILSSLHGA